MSSFIGCATDPSDPYAEEGPDFDDPEAKADGALRPSGFFNVVDPYGFDEGEPRIGTLDLRTDGTYYDEEFGPVQYDDYNYGEGVSNSFGTYKFTKDSHGNTYIRFTDGREADRTWRWKYTFAGANKIRFLYDTTGGFWMKRDPHPTATFVQHVKEQYEDAARTEIADPFNNSDKLGSGEARERVVDLHIAHVSPLEAFTYKVDGKKLTVVLSGPRKAVEVFAESGQLLATAPDSEDLKWSTKLVP